MFFSYENLKFRHEPFPIGLAKPLMEPSTYKELLDVYPPLELFANLPKIGNKYSYPRNSTHVSTKASSNRQRGVNFIAGLRVMSSSMA